MGSSRNVGESMLARSLRKDAKHAKKTLGGEMETILEEEQIAHRAKGASAKTVPPIVSLSRNAPPVPAAKPEDILTKFESEVEMYAAVERGKREVLSKDLTQREQGLVKSKELATSGTREAREALLLFGLKKPQMQTLEQLLGQLFGQPIERVGRQELREAQERANSLIAKMKVHWDAALPEGQTRANAMRSVFDKLEAERKRDKDLNPSRFVRKKLFDPWRVRFMKRLGRDAALRSELSSAAGIELLMDSDVPKFSLKLDVGGKEVKIGFDVDHAETRLSDAVRTAKTPEDLLSVIESDGMQLLTPRENRIQIEALRKATREYFAQADDAMVDYVGKLGRKEAAELNRDIDAMLEKLERAGEGF